MILTEGFATQVVLGVVISYNGDCVITHLKIYGAFTEYI